MVNAILDPTGGPRIRPASSRAARPATLRGTTVALLENTKRNAGLLLAELGQLLVDEQGVSAVRLDVKHNFASPLPAPQLKELVENCDVAITGVGDCGSCSASAVADGVAFENAGVPAAVICSDAFTITADAMADAQGAPGYRYLTTAHPVAILGHDQIRDRARELLPQVVALLTENPA